MPLPLRTVIGVSASWLAVAALTVATPASRQSQSAPPVDASYLGVFPALVEGLKATPGCLGVETAKTGSGKQVIFAWFENKAAARAWYDSDVHQRMMKQYQPDAVHHAPLEGVQDDGPIMAIASVTLSPTMSGRAPFSQIAIELYRPLNGGISIGGRFAPDALRVPGLREGFVPKDQR
jgi:quinol monooxygenase YgiN